MVVAFRRHRLLPLGDCNHALHSSIPNLIRSEFLEGNRSTDNGTLARVVVSNAIGAVICRSWKGYRQRAAQAASSAPPDQKPLGHSL